MASIEIQNRDKIAKFFFPKGKGCSPMLLWLILHVTLACLSMGGSLIITIPLQIFFSKRKKKTTSSVSDVTVAEIDQIFEEEIALLKKRSLDRLGLDISQSVAKPIEFIEPSVYRARILRAPEDTTGLNPQDVEVEIGDNSIKLAQDEYCAIQKKEEASNTIRYTLVEFTILYPTESYIAYYKALYSRITGQIITEKSQEIFYSDVTQVSTDKVNEVEKLKIGTGTEELVSKSRSKFIMEVSSGSKVEISFADPELQKMFGNTALTEEYADSASQSLRKIIREKKG